MTIDTTRSRETMLDLLQVRSQHLRSVQIERDYSDPNASADYVVTPFVAVTFERLAQSLQYCSTARAWRLTGDYGSGKSSFMLAFARYAARARRSLPAALAADSPPFRLEPVLVVGEREPLARSLLRGLRQTIARTGITPPRGLLKALAEAEALGATEILGLIETVGDWVRAKDVGAGLLIIFDELGKNFEHAAATPVDGDIQLLQDLAEAAARSGTKPLVTVAILHQALTSYASELPSLERKEWEKVSGRFEEIVFAPPIEQSAALTAAALGIETSKLPKTLVAASKEQMRTAVEAGWYGPGASLANLEALAPALAPFDALTLPILGRILRRFGQNERSLFSFLSSAEPGGLVGHAAQPLVGYRPYRLSDLYDYIAQNLSATLASGPSGVRWHLIDGVVRSGAAQSPLEGDALKAVGLVNLLDDPSLALTPELLGSTLADGAGAKEARKAIARLRDEARVLYDRGAGGGLCLWPHTSVDLQAAFDEALKAVAHSRDILTALRPVLPTEPLVARRHYVKTGTMRHFEVLYTPVATLADLLDQTINETADGRLLMVLSRTDRERAQAREIVAAHEHWPKTLVVGIPPAVGDVAPLLRDLDAWTWVANETPALAGDRLAREEVARQIGTAEERLRRALTTLLDFRGGSPVATQWLWRGEPLAVRSGRELSEALSVVCDTAYAKAPKIANELLNRRQLSSAAARARSTLIEALAQGPDQRALGLDDKHMPPEMAAYLSILKAGNVHVERDGRWQIVRPESDHLNIAPALDRIGEVLRAEEDRRVPYLEVAAALRGADYGIRDGLIPLLIAVYLAAYWHHTAVYEDGTYLDQVGGPEFMRILKEPEHFTLQHCAVEGVRTAVFARLATAVGVPTQRDAPDLLDVVRPLMQFIARLPDHARRTRNIKVTTAAVRTVLLRVQDPSAMLFKDLPKACGLEPFSASRPVDEEQLDVFVSAIADAVRELQNAYPDLLIRIGSALAKATEAGGTANQLQPILARRAEPLAAIVSEPELKSFVIRLADDKLSPKLWLESIASFLARKPPERWAEPDEREFHHRLKLLARRLIRVEAAVGEAAPQAVAGESVFRMVITSGDGRELEDLVRGPTDDAAVAELEQTIGAMIDLHGRNGLLAFARAILARNDVEETPEAGT